MATLIRFFALFLLRRYTRIPEVYQNLVSPVSYVKARALEYLLSRLSKEDWVIIGGAMLFILVFLFEGLGMVVLFIHTIGASLGLWGQTIPLAGVGMVQRFASFGFTSTIFWVFSLLGCLGTVVVWVFSCLRRIILVQQKSTTAYRAVWSTFLASITLHLLAFLVVP